ncbi:MAG: hypothetical protein KDD32_05595 [Bacteroidetes bacterium]|nr:hypothetical protein [Bacteroidota bacterium]
MSSSGRIKILVIIGIVVFLGSCKKDKVYNVPLIIQPYIDEFIAEAATRGLPLDIDNLVVVFEEELKVDGVEAAGLCQRGGRNGTPTIKIDTTSVNWQTNLSSREQLVFHELGHCVLERSHIEERLSNGNYRSTMRPTGEQIYGPEYSSFKRSYYFDELFDIETPEQSWSIDVPQYNDISPAAKTLAFEEPFNDANGGWSTGQSNSTSRKIEGGFYKIKILQAGGYYVDNTLAIQADKDFEIEYNLTLDESGFSGILWGGEERPGFLPSFKLMYIGNEVVSIGSIVHGTESSYEAAQNNSPLSNQLVVRKIGVNLYCYLNQSLIDNIMINESFGDKIGIAFGGAAGTEIMVDNIKLLYLN